MTPVTPLLVAAKGKGTLNALRRGRTIQSRYGWTAAKMDHILIHFSQILRQFNCGATFPITSVALARSRGVVEKYQAQNIEFAVHGYYHVDHSRLSFEQQLADFARARHLFEQRGVACQGFRSPYLRSSGDTMAAARQSGFLYDSSQSLAFDVVDGLATEAYHRVLDFYGSLPAAVYPALPRLEEGLVRIPYSVPDDEGLIDRLKLDTAETKKALWLAMLQETYRQGELFTLGLHPERFYLCEPALVATLRAARALSPGVWIARLDEIAHWWLSHINRSVSISPGEEGEIRIHVDGADGIAMLARGVVVVGAPTEAWDGEYCRVKALAFSILCNRSTKRPFIGVSHSSSPGLITFLRQQGYIFEQAENDQQHVVYLDYPRFSTEDERPLLKRIEQGRFPLVRISRWPYGARSALAITGDIDALTIWDYGLRLLGR